MTAVPRLPRVAVVSVTEQGAALARRLPYRHEPGPLGDAVRRLWPEVDGLVLVAATGIAVRVIAPLLADKHADPAVVVLDDGGRWAVALAGGHHGANALATEVAGFVGATPVVTTASDGAGLPALDDLPGFRASGAVAAVTRAWLDGRPPALDRSALPGWPLPPGLAAALADPPPTDAAPGGTRVVVTDRRAPGDPDDPDGTGDTGGADTVWLRPPSLVVGVGSSSGADPEGIARLVDDALAGAGLSPDAVGLVASVDLKRHERGIVALADRLGVEYRTFPAPVLAGQPVPTPSAVVAEAVGTPSVAEAAALLAAGPGAELVVPKQRSTEATVAVARRARPEGHLAVVGLG
ncbi:MAG TPA: cobalamin biosynthesis protein, partial [Acidimicrobiales bacterium]